MRQEPFVPPPASRQRRGRPSDPSREQQCHYWAPADDIAHRIVFFGWRIFLSFLKY
jgi:hypothetical protein